ncbi:MAG TPA: hypothetical protein VGG74_31400 [Kofleriaceae bacterium]|jgi:hypothetical protein
MRVTFDPKMLRARVHKVTRNTTHSRGMVVDGKVVAGERLPRRPTARSTCSISTPTGAA